MVFLNAILRGATGEISNFYNLSARLLIFNTFIPLITKNTYFKISFISVWYFLSYDFFLKKKGLFLKSLPSDKFEVYDLEFFYNISDIYGEKTKYPYLRNVFWEEKKN